MDFRLYSFTSRTHQTSHHHWDSPTQQTWPISGPQGISTGKCNLLLLWQTPAQSAWRASALTQGFSSVPPSSLGSFTGMKEHKGCLQKQKKKSPRTINSILHSDRPWLRGWSSCGVDASSSSLSVLIFWARCLNRHSLIGLGLPMHSMLYKWLWCSITVLSK